MITTLDIAHAWGPGAGGPGFGAPWLFVLIPLFWLLVFVLLFVFLGRRWRRNGPEAWREHQTWQAVRSAESTLAERFAQGDIDEVEYRARLEVLRANAPRPGPAR